RPAERLTDDGRARLAAVSDDGRHVISQIVVSESAMFTQPESHDAIRTGQRGRLFVKQFARAFQTGDVNQRRARFSPFITSRTLNRRHGRFELPAPSDPFSPWHRAPC